MSEANKRLAPDYVNALSRSLYWAYSKATTGEPKPWRGLTPEDRKIWAIMARRAIRGIENLDAAETGSAAEGTDVAVSATPETAPDIKKDSSPATAPDAESSPPAAAPAAKKRPPIRSQLERLLGSAQAGEGRSRRQE
jgi:hypothetical protein